MNQQLSMPILDPTGLNFSEDEVPANGRMTESDSVENGSIESDDDSTIDREILDICETTVNPDDVKVSQSDFKLLSVLGRGGYGKVFLAKKNDNGQIYAMKVLKKASIITNAKDTAHTKTERSILERIKSPGKLYLVLEFLPGGELFNQLERFGTLTESQARFYLSEISLALGHLHSMGIIYRDLKPENVLLDAEGHVKLTDFGLSKERIGRDNLTHTFCGTIEYMAPEILKRRGHGRSVDWWSLGTLMYDMLSGGPPFNGTDRRETVKQILHGYFSPLSNISPAASSLLSGLLAVDVANRLGAGPDDVEAIKRHSFFRCLDWKDVLRRAIQPPFRPSLQSDTDVSLFDPRFTLENPIESPDDAVPIPAFDEADIFANFTYVAPTIHYDMSHEPWISSSGSRTRRRSGPNSLYAMFKRPFPDTSPASSSSARRRQQATSSSSADQQDELPTPIKRPLLASAPIPVSFGHVQSIDQLDKKGLQLQNRKLWDAFTERHSLIADLRLRIEQLEGRQVKDESVLYVINQYWNQLDEDTLVLLQRYDSDAEDDVSSVTESFLTELASWDKEELSQKLHERVHFSKRIIARLLSACERLNSRQLRLRQKLATSTSSSSSSSSQPAPEYKLEGSSPSSPDNNAKKQPDSQTTVDTSKLQHQELTALTSENERLQSLCTELHSKTRQSSLRSRESQDRVHALTKRVDQWRTKYEDLDYKFSQTLADLTRLDHRLLECQEQNKKLKTELGELNGSQSPATHDETSAGTGSTIHKSKYNDLVTELEELRELAASRLTESERTQRRLEEKVAECESLNMQLRDIPESTIIESPQYISLKTQFSLVFNELGNLRSQLDEARQIDQAHRQVHQKQIQEMEANESAIQNQMRAEMLALETQYSALRRNYETMDIDYKEALAQNELSSPINCEMRSLISTLQTQNKQLKAEVNRYRLKLKETGQDLDSSRVQLKATEEELSQVRSALADATNAVTAAAEASASSSADHHQDDKSEATLKTEVAVSTTASPSSSLPHPSTSVDTPKSESSSGCCDDVKTRTDTTPTTPTTGLVESSTATDEQSKSVVKTPTTPTVKSVLKPESFCDESQRPTHTNSPVQDDTIRDLKEKLKRSLEAQKEMSVLLNMYKVIPKEQRDKASLLQSEAKLRAELVDARAEIDRLQLNLTDSLRQRKTSSTDQASPITSSPYLLAAASASTIGGQGSGNHRLTQLQLELQLNQRRRHTLQQEVDVLQSRLTNAKQQEEVLLKEIDVAGQAFEDVQEQNVRLVKNLREKDEANLKLMSERLKTTQVARLLKEDKQLLEEQTRLMQAKIEALNRTVAKQEEKERVLLTNLSTLEKETSIRQSAQEAYKRKCVESQQTAEDLRVNVQKYQSQLKDAQQSVQEKASAFERASFRHQRLQEETSNLRRKYERLRKIDQFHSADELLLAEIQDYKEQINCPTCKTNRKDAILTKCFHVFCLNCLKTRYETRNRKCPKCNATFGANDYHRIYFT